MLKLKLQYFGHLMRRVDSLEKTPMLGGIGGKRRRGLQRMRWLGGITDSMDVDLGSIPGSGRYPGEGNGNPLQYSCLENLMDGGAWWATVHGVTKSQTRLSE